MSANRRLNVLLVGGSGFVSGTLARIASSRGHKVWAVTRGQRALPEGVTGLTADRHDQAAFERVIRTAGTHWDLVVDCIAYEPADAGQDVALFRGLAGHFVLISTDFVFDPSRRRFPQPQDSQHFAAEGYGGKKRLAELELMNADAGEMIWTIVRPCHIYGPGSQLGCLPMHLRDAQLISRITSGEALQLVGGGHFLQQPIFAPDLARLILSLVGNERTYGQAFCTAGPDIVESRDYYRIIADALGKSLNIEEVPVSSSLAAHPDFAPFLCHRIYDLGGLRAAGVEIPSTPIDKGLREHVESLQPAPFDCTGE
jgi:nucleoside-diphosphate-sugar epimerase